MLMMPPALATKSGAHRIPRAASSSATVVGRELVVGRAGDRAAAQGGDGLVVEHAAERARREHVDLGAQRGVGVDPVGAELVGERALALVDVGDHEPRAGRGERCARARRRRGRGRRRAIERPLEVARAPHALARDADRLLDAERGPRAGVAGAAALDGEAGDVPRAPRRSPSMSASEVPTSSAVR